MCDIRSRQMPTLRGLERNPVTRLVEARDRLGLTNAQLGYLINRKRETVSRMVAGKLPIAPIVLAQLESMVPVYEAVADAKRYGNGDVTLQKRGG